jgi:hypothetical protein
MRVVYHPAFSQDVRRFEAEYRKISDTLAARFRNEVLQAIKSIKRSPTKAGHFLTTPTVRLDLRRSNLRSFPFFILYSNTAEELLLGSVIPSRSDPLTLLVRFPGERH